MKENRKRIGFFGLAALLALCGIVICVLIEAKSLELVSGVCNLHDSFDCDSVLSSTYGELFGVSLSRYGLFFYFFVFYISVYLYFDRVRARAYKVLFFFLGICASLFSIYLFLISKFVLKAYCPFCLATYLINGLFLLVAILGLRPIKDSLPKIKELIPLNLLLWVLLASGSAFIVPDIVLSLVSAPDPVGTGERWPLRKRIDVEVRTGVHKDYTQGPDDALIQIVKFSDLQCPFCRRFSFVIDDLLEKHAEHIQFVFKNYPLDSSCNKNMQRTLHKHACVAAEAVRCAGEQGAFWTYLKDVYALTALDDKSLSDISVRAALKAKLELSGGDVLAYEQCMRSGHQREALRKDVQDGVRLNISGTPSIWVNGKQLLKPSQEKLEKVVQEILTRAGG